MFSKLGCAVVAGRSGLQPVPQQVVPVIQVITADGGLPAKSRIIAIKWAGWKPELWVLIENSLAD